MMELCGLSCGYGDRVVTKDINLKLNSGDICCILGHNGVGKSTLFKTILKLQKPLSGSIFIDKEDISGWSDKKMSTYCAYVAQSHIPPFPYTVKEVVMIGRMGHIGAFSGPGKKDEEIVSGILEELNIADLADVPYTRISGGERQLVLVGKALAQEPKCLVLDEPTANLDYGNKVIVLNTIKHLAQKGMLVVFTTHDPEQALLLDAKTLILFKNDPVVLGEANEVVTDKTLKRAYNTDIRVVEIVDDSGNPVRVCIPLLS